MDLFAHGEKKRIEAWARGLDREVALAYAPSDHLLADRFKRFADQLTEWVPRLRIKREGDAPVSRPTFFIGRGVAYQALPLNRELDPFLTALGGGAIGVRIAPEVRRRLDRLRAPALVKIYVTPHCPFCPAAVSLLLDLAAACDYIRVTVIDGELFPDAARDDRIGAAPTIILDDRLRWTGSVDPLELVTLMVDRDPASLGADALRGMIEEGDAEGVARMMAECGRMFPAFIELLAHPRWSVRLGAMVAFETLAELDPELAAEVAKPLMEVFDEVDDTVKGDLLHVLGESGNRVAMPLLTTVARDHDDEEVRAAAGEAIDKMR